MNRRQKIIVSVTGIFLVLLILVGLTYAYFLTRIDGNDANKSISVTTANLSLVYSDNSEEFITSTDPIVPGKFKSSKTFTVTNNGNAKVDSYAVILENFSVKYVNDIPNTDIKANTLTNIVNSDDFKMTITCTITSSDATRNGKSCNGMNGTLPTSNDILVMNAIEQGDTHNYTMTLEFIETGNNQSDDMNKRIEGLINIIDSNETVDLKGTVAATNVTYVEVSENISATQTSDKTDSKVQMLEDIDKHTSIKEVAFETIRSYLNSNKEYKLVGIPAGNYNIKLYNSSNTQVGSTQSIEILKGDESSVNGNKITITNSSRETKIDFNSIGNIIIDEKIKELGILLDTIIKRAKSINESDSKTLGYAKYSETYRTIPAEAPNASDEALLLTEDDDYTEKTKMPSYYFRGNVKDNYVNFGGMCWRIVRIAGDGSIKLILEDKNTTCEDEIISSTDLIKYTGNWAIAGGVDAYGYDMIKDSGRYVLNYLKGNMVRQFYKFQNELAKKINTNLTSEANLTEINNVLSTKLKSGDWCIGDKAYLEGKTNIETDTPLNETEKISAASTPGNNYNYESYIRLHINNPKQPTLKCNGSIYNEFADITGVSSKTFMYVGALTADEATYAGITYLSTTSDNYLINEEFKKEGGGEIDRYMFILASPAYHSGPDELVFYVTRYNSFYDEHVAASTAIRPSLNLISGILFEGGNGTKEEPYVIR